MVVAGPALVAVVFGIGLVLPDEPPTLVTAALVAIVFLVAVVWPVLLVIGIYRTVRVLGQASRRRYLWSDATIGRHTTSLGQAASLSGARLGGAVGSVVASTLVPNETNEVMVSATIPRVVRMRVGGGAARRLRGAPIYVPSGVRRPRLVMAGDGSLHEVRPVLGDFEHRAAQRQVRRAAERP